MSNPSRDLVQQGLAHHRAGRTEDAARLYERALALDPTSFDALQLLALIRFRSGQIEIGITLFERALAIAPHHAATLNNYGNALLAAGRWTQAGMAYRSAIAHSVTPPPVMFRNLGIALSEAGSDDDAKRFLERALEADATDIEAINRLAGLAVKYRDWSRAEAFYTRSLALRDSLAVRLARLMARQNLVQWDEWEADVARVVTSEPTDDEQIDPFKLMFIVDDPAVQRRYADAFGRYGQRRRPPPRDVALTEDAFAVGKRPLRVGYLSWDIRRHPVAQLVAGVLESHDPHLFEITVHALGPDCVDAERIRIRAACEHFVVHAGRSEEESIALIRESNHDILVDLMGYTRDARPGILIARPARTQIGWLGYPGTLGAGMLDGLIADRYVIPDDQDANFAEEILRVPDCYLPADRSRQVNPPMARADYGFADQDVVMACFCQLQKITPVVFDLWMETMAALPALVLWLFDAPTAAATRLRERAVEKGISAERIRFTHFVTDHADHLARYAIADFAVDTFPYGSHTTAIDALWVGCPLVAWSGNGFASRVSGSVLRAAGCPELIADSASRYQSLILQLGSDPALREGLRTRLVENRETSPLFDVRKFTREYEKILLAVAARHPSPSPTNAVPTPERAVAGDR